MALEQQPKRRPAWLDPQRSPNAFSHSERCDLLFGRLDDLPGGAAHVGCNCWCHAVDFDKNEAPEYVLNAQEASDLKAG